MSRTDTISDAFTVIRNASRAKQEETYIPYSNSLVKICDILKREGYLENFKEVDLEGFRKIKVYLKYQNKKGIIGQIKKISKPGRRIYVKRDAVPRALNGYGVTIVSTPEGMFTDKEAREKGLGGEVIGMVW
ncbi:MAG: 30S ribosomal protein S8 [Candidatus Omnitrophica bacterium]|nr:30S ribosomal protein S8 [Candidatus Omnitrophota bacterium]MBU2251303.1 30S ribosomal protein S8 [Candidatus Omnitrophota bacterium]MBU2266120.1 30S ribosomal protein S8 [Candidatus Omnitrophota bacterium]MBU2474197.1 30S ribosomal protein S8 [Candidatus Omnitrophota bacterium]